MKKFIVEVISNDEGVHTISVYKKHWFLGKTLLKTGVDTRSQYALTRAFKGLLPKN